VRHGDAPSNADFYVRVMGLRIVKKTINQTDMTTYHIFYGDEKASYGNNISFFEYRGRPDGFNGAGNCHRIVWRVGSPDALDFWERRAAEEGRSSGADLDATRESLLARDHIDAGRATSPLVMAEGAVHVDGTAYSLREVVDLVLALVEAHPREGDEGHADRGVAATRSTP